MPGGISSTGLTAIPIPPGGLTGEVLVKLSNETGDYGWGVGGGGGGDVTGLSVIGTVLNLTQSSGVSPITVDLAAADVVFGPGASVDNRLVTWDGATGALIQDGTTIIATGVELDAPAGNITLKSRGVNILVGNNLAQTDIYGTGVLAAQVSDGGINIRESSTGTNARYRFLGKTGTPENARINFDSSTDDLRISNFATFGAIEFFTDDGVGLNTQAVRMEASLTRIYSTGVEVARSTAAAAGGWQVNNTVTGGGFERVLTTSDLSAADVTGPASSIDNRIVTFDGTSGKLIQDGTTIRATLNGLSFDGTASFTVAGNQQLSLSQAGTPQISFIDTGILNWSRGAALGMQSRMYNTNGGINFGLPTFNANARFGQANASGIFEKEWITFARDAEVALWHNNVEMARTALAASGGFEVNNTVTGAGFERALTTSDLASNVFGSNFESDFEATEQSTTSVTYVTPYTYTTAALPAGDYMIMWSFDGGEATDKEASHRVLINGSPVATSEWRIKKGVAADGKAYLMFAGHRVQTLGAGTLTIAFQYRTADTAYIRNKQVSIYRVN